MQALVACILALRSPLVPRFGAYWSGAGTVGESVATVNGRIAPLSNALVRSARAAAFDLWPPLPGRRTSDNQYREVQYWQGVGVDFVSGMGSGGRSHFETPEEWDAAWKQRYRAGWPMRSMEAKVDDARGVRGGVLAPRRWMARGRNLITVSYTQPSVQPVIPLRPRPLGTAVNSLMFSAPFLLVLLARAARRRRRDRAGRCLRCGYSRAGLTSAAPCPECGHTPADGSHRESGGGVGAAAPASAAID